MIALILELSGLCTTMPEKSANHLVYENKTGQTSLSGNFFCFN
jgi:hypothetical protein